MNWIFKSIGVIILIIILNNINFSDLLNILINIKIEYCLFAILLTIPFFLVKIFRWSYILKNVGININFYKSTLIYGAGLFAGMVTPGHLGELIRGVFLSKKGYDLSLSISTVILERFLDLLLLIILSIPTAIILLNIKIKVESFFLGLILIPILFIMIYKLFLKIKIIDCILNKSFFSKLINKIKKNIKYLKSFIYNKKILVYIFTITIIAFLTNVIRFYLLLMSLSINIPVIFFIFGIAFVSVAGLIPISIAGIGTRDAAMILFFASLGFPAENAIAFSSLILIVAYGFNILLGFPAWLLISRIKNN